MVSFIGLEKVSMKPSHVSHQLEIIPLVLEKNDNEYKLIIP